MEYFSPTEILDRNPHIAQVWTARHIGYLLHLKLVSGRKIKMYNSCVAKETDVQLLYNLKFGQP